jgi:murein DD-endopeptidase MepM/ murein hydrolase activator NlpD
MSTPLAPKLLQLGTTWRYSTGVLHAAYDYPVAIGTPARAVRDGTVLDTHDGEPNRIPPDSGFTGAPVNFVLLGITYRNRPASVLYMHLSPGLKVTPGEKVRAGQKLALSGNSGHTTGPHLHVAAMFGHHDGATKFAYLDGIPSTEHPPDGVASNGVTIYPPTQVFGRRRPGPFDSGLVLLSELHLGVENSDSVRRLQHRLNQVSLDRGVELPVTGNYLEMTRDEVQKWQIQKDGAEAGSSAANGNLGPLQAAKLFSKRYTLQDHG